MFRLHRISWSDLCLFVRETWPRWRALDPELLAAGLSYFTLFSLAPLLLVLLTLSGPILSRPHAQELILDRASLWLGDGAMESVKVWMNAPASPHPHRAAFLGLLISVVAGSQVMGYVKRTLNRIWDLRQEPYVSVCKEWLLYWLHNVVMLGAFALFLILSLFLEMAARGTWGLFRAVLPMTTSHSISWFQGINFGVSLFSFCLLFGLIFRFVPDAPMAWEDVWGGALLTSILLAIGKACVMLYAGYATFATGYGAASSVLVLLLSIYIGANIFIFGAVFTRAYSEHYGSHRHTHKL